MGKFLRFTVLVISTPDQDQPEKLYFSSNVATHHLFFNFNSQQLKISCITVRQYLKKRFLQYIPSNSLWPFWDDLLVTVLGVVGDLQQSQIKRSVKALSCKGDDITTMHLS